MNVYCNGKNRPLSKALKIITEDWVDAGNSTSQTTVDLARACKELVHSLEEIVSYYNSPDPDLDLEDIALKCMSIAKHALRDARGHGI